MTRRTQISYTVQNNIIIITYSLQVGAQQIVKTQNAYLTLDLERGSHICNIFKTNFDFTSS
jgi:hypothetical protein